MSPSSTARHFSTRRKIALCAAALVVTLLPTACGTAYADDDAPEAVEVGGVSAAEPADEGEDADAGGQEPPADDGQQRDQEGQNNNNQNNQGQNNGDLNNDGGDKGGDFNEAPGNAQGGQEPPPPDGVGGNEGGQLDVLGTDCTNSQLEPHNGFEIAPACVDTSMGEVAAEELNPTLLITEAPQTVAAGQDFTLSVSTRNLIRDRFLGAAAGGYYLESSFLNEEGIQRGHFHTACRILESTAEAPDPAPAPEFFVATQDNGGGAGADTVQINVTGLDEPGTYQCSSWAGDGSHRTPMMQRANQTPAFDSVRVTVE
jgi:hypothetical protein